MSQKLSRRSFLSGAAVSGAVLAFGSLAACTPAADKKGAAASGEWAEEVDLLICGSGAAGMACAVEAKDNGVEKVLIIEKLAQTGGTTCASQGMIAGFDTKLQKDQNIALTYDQMYTNLMKNASYRLDPALTKITVERCGETVDWLADRIKVPFSPDIMVAYGPLKMMHIVEGGGMGFSEAFNNTLSELGVETKKGTALTEIILDDNGSVAGVKATASGKEMRIKAKAVMVATGGYAYNPELAAALDPEKRGTFGIGYPGSEGDGLIAASNVGAGTSHTNDLMAVLKDYEIMKDFSGTSDSANVHGFTALPNMIMVGTAGSRFCDESAVGYMSQNLNRPVFDQMHKDDAGFVWMISDQAAVDATGGKTFRGEKLPYITGADPETLAKNLGVDLAGLQKTIDGYNAAVQAGIDPEFGRRPAVALTAPFVALAVVPCEIITYGGVSRNENGEVIKIDQTPIPGLYIGGEASCNSAYMGFTLSNGFTWGRIAGKNSAAYMKG